MKSQLLFMLKIIAAVINEEELPESIANIDWNMIYNISVSHNITNIIGYAMMTGRYSIDAQLKEKFLKSVSNDISIDTVQNKKSKELFAKFDSNDIEYMPLKGLNVKRLYPVADLRKMSDMDILIKEDQWETISKVMQELGYEFKTESDHEIIYTIKPFVCVELHKRMVPTYNEDLYEYYGDGWKLAVPFGNGNQYMLPHSDEFVYLIAHLAKHYRDAGIGIKHITDIWLYQKKVADLDFEYINKQLKKLNLYEFYKNISKMMQCWFDGAEFDKISVSITEFIFKSGVFGNLETRAVTAAMKDNMDEDLGKTSKYKYLRLLFPKMWYMKNIFPALANKPYLLPYYWIKRLVVGLLFKRSHISYHVNKTNSIDNDNLIKCSEHMKMVGLDVYAGRKKE